MYNRHIFIKVCLCNPFSFLELLTMFIFYFFIYTYQKFMLIHEWLKICSFITTSKLCLSKDVLRNNDWLNCGNSLENFATKKYNTLKMKALWSIYIYFRENEKNYPEIDHLLNFRCINSVFFYFVKNRELEYFYSI